ncbi:shikimate dehydrogenase [Mesorhizobium sp.]|uniref:shikimate dehydrogenase family protein n=1 Tax=Mesorhizobium sp. TaxID=1871066 RepID=UPI0025DFF1DA|nr:shikimate dehydrogenase [Mesorhizobium sp.]
MEITGRTRVLGILAHPTDHVKAPPGINRIARERGKDAVMVPFNVAPADLQAFVGTLRTLLSFDGAIVTVPHKQAILTLCDDLTPHARAVGAANILRREPDGRLIGGQLDGAGFIQGLRHAGIEPKGKGIYLAGAGGAASAIAFAAAEAEVAFLTLANRSQGKADELRRRLLQFNPRLAVGIGTRDPSGHDIVINGTTLGMTADDDLPVDAERLSPGMVVAEVVMVPEMTPLLEGACAKGCQIHLGHHMLDHQLRLMADFMGL